MGLAEGFTLLIIDKRCGILDPFMLTSDALLCRTGQGGFAHTDRRIAAH